MENRGKDCNVDGENQGSVGHISNEVSGEGGVPCPVADQSWVISGKPGQHVRLILYDFSIPDENSSYGEGFSFRQKKEDRKCRQYGTVYDAEKEETQMICGSHAERMSHVYTSTGHNVKLYLQASRPSQRYLIRFSGGFRDRLRRDMLLALLSTFSLSFSRGLSLAEPARGSLDAEQEPQFDCHQLQLQQLQLAPFLYGNLLGRSQ